MSSGQNGRIIGTIVGAVVGYFTAGVGWGLGAAIGGAAGSLLDPKQKVEGPRLDDLKVQRSEYGIGIPTLYATERISPNIIWSTDKLEVATTTSEGGKGGGVEQTAYKYYVHMRLALADTPRDGSVVAIVKIFQDGKLLWDASSGIPVGSALASAENLFASFILYQGDAAQLPNPEEEAWVGAGNAPAYRGIVSIYMRAIECVAGRVPQFSFVLSSGGVVGQETTTFNELDVADNITSDYSGIIGATTAMHVATSKHGGDTYWPAYLIGHDFAAVQSMGRTEYSNPLNLQDFIPAIGSQDDPQTISRFVPSAGQMRYDADHHMTGLRTVAWEGSDADGKNLVTQAAYDSVSDTYALRVTSGNVLLMTPGGDYSPSFSGNYLCHSWYNNILTVAYQPALSSDYRVLIRSYDIDTGWTTLADVFIVNSPLGLGALLFHDAGGLYLRMKDGTGTIYKIGNAYDWTTLEALGAYPFPSGNEQTFYASDDYAIVGPRFDGTNAIYTMLRFNAVVLADALVSDIIADQCERSSETRYDVAAIPDTARVRGYKIPGPASARTNIDPLLSAFDIYAVDEDGLIKFKMREDIESVGTVTFDELGQSESGEIEPAMPLTRTQEIDFPRSMTVSYIEPDLDYQTSSETAIRQVTDATEDAGIALPLALMSSDRASTAASRLLYAAWSAQNTRSAKLSRKFAYASPGDGLTFEYPRGSFKLQRIGTLNDTGVLLETALEPGDAALFTQISLGATGFVPPQIVAPLPPPTRLDILDMPILRDADNDAGNYSVLTPLATGSWRGASLLLGNDNINFSAIDSVTTPGITGIAETLLASGTPWVIDHTSTVVIKLVGDGALSTVTWDEIFADGSVNLAALVTSSESEGFPDAVVEVFQFRVANDLGGGRYELMDFVRCLFGTERVSFNHSVGDRFVMLQTAGTVRVHLEPGAIGSTKYYKAVSFGVNPDNVASQANETIGYGLRPLSPVNVKLDRTPADGSIEFTWGRRTRFSHNALRSIMPLGEVSEIFEVVIYDSGYSIVKNVYRVYETSFTYTADDLSADGNSQLGSIFYRIYQISDTVGRGVPYQPGQGIP